MDPEYQEFIESLVESIVSGIGTGGGNSGGGGVQTLPPPPPPPSTTPDGQYPPAYAPPVPDSGVPVDTQSAAVQSWLGQIAAYLVSQPGLWQALANLVALRGQRGVMTPACARLMLEQLPEQKRRAVDQFLCGVEFPVGLSADGETTFAALRIAAAGVGVTKKACGCN